MATLYEIVATDKEFKDFLATMEDTELDAQAVQDTLDSIKAELEVKAEGYICVLRQMEANQKAYKAEADFFSAKAKTLDNNIKRLKDTLCKALIDTGHDDKAGLTAGKFTLKVAGNGGKQPVTITGEVPDSFYKVVLEIDNDKIRDYLENLPKDEECEWAHLEPRGKHLTIK